MATLWEQARQELGVPLDVEAPEIDAAIDKAIADGCRSVWGVTRYAAMLLMFDKPERK